MTSFQTSGNRSSGVPMSGGEESGGRPTYDPDIRPAS
jgi:hypothetical protein